MSLLNSINLPQSIVSTSHPQTKNMSPAIAEEANNIPSASTISQSASFPAHTSPRSTVSGSLIPNSAPTTRGLSMAPSLPNRPGVLGPPVGRNIHGIAPPIQIPSNVLVPSVATDSSSAVPRLSVPTTHAFNATVQSQIFSPYPSSAPMAAHPHGTWLQPPQVGGMTRPPFLPYPVAFPGPLPFPAHGMPLPSIPLPDPQPPGVTPVRVSPVVSVSSATSGHNHAGSSGMQAEITPSGMDNQNHLRDVASVDGTAMNEHFDAWTAHRSEEGAVYYYNALTRESTYDKPSGFKGEPEKVSVHPTPVSMVNLSGTDWVLVTASDGKRYYYNSKSKVSSWQIPYEVSELRKKQESEKIKDSLSVPSSNILPEKGSGTISLNAPAINTGGRDAVALRPSNVLPSSSTLDLIKKKLQDCGTPATSTTVTSPTKITSEINSSKVDVLVKVLQSENSKDKPKDPNDSGNMSDTSSDSEDEDSGPTKEECIIQFKEMLKERGVAPFSKWEKELPKILFDPRFKAIPSYSARRSLFEHYVKTRAEEERKEKRAAQKAAVEGFKKLLDEASPDIDLKTDYQTFRKKWGSDPRFEALDRKDREHLLNERVFSLKKAAKEKTLAVRAAATAGFKSMLREKGDITVNSRWSRVKDSLRDDPRYKSVKHEDREVFFNEFLSELKAAGEEAQRETKAKRDEEVETFEKLKEREREMHKRKEREEQEMERVRLKVRRKEAVVTFQALLVETIKDPQASWAESKPKLDKDPQGRAANPELDPSDTDKLFREHVKMLQERCAHEFRALLSEILTAEAASQATEDGKTVFNSWSMAKRLLKPDPRYNKMPRKERESMWHRCAEDMLRKLKSDEQWEKDKYDLKARASADPGRLSSGQRAHDRR